MRQILFPTDFSECAGYALPWALLLAEELEAELHLLHALVLHADDPWLALDRFPDRESLFEQLHRAVESHMAGLGEEHARRPVAVHKALRRGISVLPVLLGYAEEIDADLIVLGTHGRRAVGRALLGSVARETVRLAPCPVLTVGERREPTAPRVRRVGVAVDLSEPSGRALQAAVEVASALEAELHVVHVVEEALYPELYYPVLAGPLALTPELTEEVTLRLDTWVAERVPKGGAPAVHVRVGRASFEIGRFAEDEEVDLLVVGSHGRTGLPRVLLGSVAEEVVRRAACPVLTVKALEGADGR